MKCEMYSVELKSKEQKWVVKYWSWIICKVWNRRETIKFAYKQMNKI